MPEIRVPLIPLGEFANNLWNYTSGRLVGTNGAYVNVPILPPDGASLQTLRIKGSLSNNCSFLVKLYRTLKDNYNISPQDVIVSQTIPFSSPGVFNQSLPLAPSGKNVVDNTLYNYTFMVVANAPSGTLAFISEIALLF